MVASSKARICSLVDYKKLPNNTFTPFQTLPTKLLASITIPRYHLVGHCLITVTTAIPALDRDDLEVQRTQVHADVLPSVKVVLDSDRATDARRVADRDVLVEGRGALDGWLIDALILPDGVCGTIAVYCALLRARLIDAHYIVHNVVLDKRVCRPTIH